MARILAIVAVLIAALPASFVQARTCTDTITTTKTKTKTKTTTTTDTDTITHTKTKTITATNGGSTVTLPASTITLPASTITLPASTITLAASTITLSASTITLPATTVTVTATTCSSSSSSTSKTSSTAGTGVPTCTQAASPSGSCAYAADYNSGTGPQLWAGAASSLDACALLCAGEPGCLSLAYDPSATLQCVLFNTAASGLTTTADSSSATTFYDSTCFSCSGSAPPRPPTDNGCTPSLQPPAGSTCDQPVLFGGIPMFQVSQDGNTAASLGACEQQCLGNSQCQSFSFDGTNCGLYSVSVYSLELNGVFFPVNPGVAGSYPLYDRGCFVCPAVGCTCPPVTKRDLARREAGMLRREAIMEQREAELERRVVAVAERELGHEAS